MRDIIPYIFWPWFVVSCGILLRRRIGGGSWKAPATPEETTSVEFLSRPSSELPTASVLGPPTQPPDLSPTPSSIQSESDELEEPAPAVAVAVDPDRPRSHTLADALDGVTMPCELAPLMGTSDADPRNVAFSTTGFDPATVGSSLSDELERLGFEITPNDDRSIRAERGEDLVEAKLVSAELASDAVMAEKHPSAPDGAVVVELKLT